jgi:hypothetical protein
MAFDESLRLRVRTVCCAHEVSVLAMAGYWSFAQQVDKGRRKLYGLGDDLRLYVGALVERYVKLGLERKVLADIRYSVFSIGPPDAEAR